MMRITNKMMANTLNRNLASNTLRMSELYNQLASTRRINKPSDDPAGLVKALRLRTNLVEGEQYLANISESLGFMDTTDAAFGDINEILHVAREKTIAAATNAKTTSDFQAVAKEIRELNEQLKLIANTTYGSKYIFAGTNVTEEPYLPSGWQGNQEAIMAEIGIGVTIPINMNVKEYFAGRAADLSVNKASGINPDKVIIQNLQEGNYKINTSGGTVSEIANNLKAVNKTGMFLFYDNAGTPAAADIEAGSATGLVNTSYNGTLNIEVTAVNSAAAGPPATPNTLEVNIRGRVAIGNGEYKEINILNQTMHMDAANNNAVLSLTAGQLQIAGLTGAAEDLVIWNNSGNTLAGIDAANPQFAVGDSLKLDISSMQSSARESQNYLSAVPNAGSFFYESMGTAATLGVGADHNPAPLANDSPYSGSLLIETTKVNLANGKIGPQAQLNGGSTADDATLTLSKPLYMKIAGNLVPIADNTDLANYFNVNRADGDAVANAVTHAWYDADTNEITFEFDNTVANGTDVQAGDKITWNKDWDVSALPAPGQTVPECGKSVLYDQYGNEFQRVDSDGNQNQAMQISYDGTSSSWTYDNTYQSSKMTVNIKGHLYTGNGQYKYVELENIVIDTETAKGGQIFKIPASAIKDPAFTEDLVIWNNGADTLGGIDPTTSQIKVGDKTVITFAKLGAADSQNTGINFNYKTADGTTVEGSHNMKFDNGTFDYETRCLRFFTLNEQTGLDYSGDISLETAVFGAQDEAVTFTWSEGLFSFMEDLARKIEAGKVPETSMELGDNSERMQELLLYRSTVGARVNRLELQESRLESIQITYTELLSKTEDANIAEVIMQLQLQENVYKAALSAGARIIQPSLMDFLG